MFPGSLAQTKLVEKIGSITGALDDVAATARQAPLVEELADMLEAQVPNQPDLPNLARHQVADLNEVRAPS